MTAERNTGFSNQDERRPAGPGGGPFPIYSGDDEPAPSAEYVVLRRSDVEALDEEWALTDDPFWKPLTHDELVKLFAAAVYGFTGARSSCLQWAEHIVAHIDGSGAQS